MQKNPKLVIEVRNRLQHKIHSLAEQQEEIKYLLASREDPARDFLQEAQNYMEVYGHGSIWDYHQQ